MNLIEGLYISPLINFQDHLLLLDEIFVFKSLILSDLPINHSDSFVTVLTDSLKRTICL